MRRLLIDAQSSVATWTVSRYWLKCHIHGDLRHPMHKAAILAFDGCSASSLGGFADLLQVANSHLLQQQVSAAKMFE